MSQQDSIRVEEETLDPQDWEAMRVLGHRMIDEMIEYLSTVRERPVWQPVPDSVKAFLSEGLPRDPQEAEEVYEEFRTHVLPHPMGNIHPRFWGWVMGGGTPFGVLAEMLAATMNPNMGGGDHGATYVEHQVLNWTKEMFGFPQEASGLLVSGGSMANLVGLTVARNTQAEFDIRKEGLPAAPRRMVLYASRETHSSNQKAAELLGLGSDAYRLIPVNERFEIDLAALEAAIAADKAAGLYPFCIIGNAGTVNTGATDDLNALANIARREGMWFHVDGAFGAMAALSPDLSPLVKGMEQADSLAFDLHKWLYVPFEAGAVLVRSERAHRHAFSLTPDYLKKAERGVAAGSAWFSDYGVQLTRGFRALKIWMSIKEHGIEKYGRMIQQNVEQARYLGALIEASPELELLAPVALNIVNFRYTEPGCDQSALNALNTEILYRLHENGTAVPSSTFVNGNYAIRVAITNHRSRREDFDLLASEVIRLGRELTSQ